MYIRFKMTVMRIVTAAVLLFAAATAYSQVSVVTVVTPPYTSNFSQYSEKVKVTVISPSAGALRLSMTIKGDNGIIIQTIETGTVSVPANEPFQVPEDYLYEFFNPSSLRISGISPAELSEKGLPEGTYQICFKASVSGNTSSFTGQSCSSMFKVALAQPPRFIQPLCGSEQYKGGIQNVLISWAPATGAPRWTNYRLRIVEIRDSLLSPAQALRSGTKPSFFEEEISGTSYLYGPKDPPLEKGCRYAMEIIASDEETNTRFANGGRSEMCWFKYGKEENGFKVNVPPVSSITGPKTGNKRPDLVPKDPFAGVFFSPANVNGTLYYQYAGPNLPSQINPNAAQGHVASIPRQSGNVRAINYGGKTLQLNMSPTVDKGVAKTSLAGKIKDSYLADLSYYSVDLRDPAKSYTLNNMPISLVVKYMVYDETKKRTKLLSKDELFSSQLTSSGLLTLQPDQVVASGYTNSDGTFDLTFFLKDSLGLVSSNVTFTTGGGEFKNHYKGKLFRVLRLVVGSQHFCSPAHDIIVQPGESNTYNDLYALVRTYGLTVKTKAQASADNYADGAIEGLDVYLLRKEKITDVPEDEGYPDLPLANVEVLPGYKAVAHTKTKQDGSATFQHLVKNLGGYDKYCIYINSESSQTFNYASRLVEFCNTKILSSAGYLDIVETATYNDEYKYRDDFSTDMDLYALAPYVYGQVAYKSGEGKAEDEGRLAEGAKVNLKSGWTFLNVLQGVTTTKEDGRFSFTMSTSTGSVASFLTAEKEGYKADYSILNNSVPIKKGQKVNAGTLFLTTKAVFSGKIIDDNTGGGVRSHVSVLGGLSVYSSQPVSVTDRLSLDNASKMQTNDIAVVNEMASHYIIGQTVAPKPVVYIPDGKSVQSSREEKNKFSSTSPKSAAITTTKNSMVSLVADGPSYFALPSPSGNQTIIVAPDDNTNYYGDTIQVNLAEGNNTGVIKLTRKLHRIKLTVYADNTIDNQMDGFPGANQTLKPGQDTKAPGKDAGTGRALNGKNNQTTTGKKGTRDDGKKSESGINERNNPQTGIDPSKIQSAGGIANAKVRIVGRTDYSVTDGQGCIWLEFDGSDNFDIEVIGPDDKDFETTIQTFTGFEKTKNFVNRFVSLKKAAHITGKVTLNGKGIEGATVKVNYSGKDIQTTTDAYGSYVLRNVPFNHRFDVEATKEKYLGSSQKVEVSSYAMTGIDFELTEFTEFDFSKMYGFNINVTKVEKEGDRTFITGSFTSLPRNGQIETSDQNQSLSFTKLEVKKGTATSESGLPYPVPVTETIVTNENEAVVSLNGTFTGKLESDNNGIAVTKGANENSGYIKGKVSLNSDISFQTNAVVFNQEKIYVKSSSADQSPKAFNAIASDGTKQFGSEGIPLFNQNGKNINYTLYGFKSEAKSGLSRIEGNKVKLNTILHTNLQNTGTADLAIQLGDVELTTQSVTPLSKTETITMPLEQWSLKATKWSLNSNGFKLNEGEVVTHMANVSFTNMEIEPDALKYGTFDLKQMNIRGLTTLVVTGNASLFYQAGHWNLSIVPVGSTCGYINSLPGMPAGTKMTLSSVYLRSDKTGSYSVDTDPFKLYGLVDFNPTSLAVYDDRIELPGTINLNIPDVAERSALIKYKKSGGETKLFLQPYTFAFNTKGVDLSFSLDENSLSPSGFTAKGTLSEPGLYSVNVQLNKTASGIEIIDIPGQTFPIDKAGNRKLSGFDGEMHVNSNQWTNFVFSGDLTGANGASGRLTFTINGDITADNQSVNVSKIPTPFGDLKLTYDFDKGRIIGLLEIEQDLAGTGFVKGSAESVIDADGWYFCAGGKITMKGNPYIKNASTAMLFGDYPSLNDPFITQTFADYSYTHSLPKAFQGHISGFYIDGAAEFPVPYVPNIDINLVVVSGHASVSAGGDFSLGMNFSDAGSTFYTGSALFVNASIGIGGSIGIACAGASFGVNVELAQKGELSSNGDWFLEGTSTLTLTGSAYAGFGCCDSDCDGYWVCPCISDSWSGAVSLQLLAHMGSDDNYVRINW